MFFQALTHLPGGILSTKYGGKYTLGLGILSTAIFTLITPIVIDWGKISDLMELLLLLIKQNILSFSNIYNRIRWLKCFDCTENS